MVKQKESRCLSIWIWSISGHRSHDSKTSSKRNIDLQ